MNARVSRVFAIVFLLLGGMGVVSATVARVEPMGAAGSRPLARADFDAAPYAADSLGRALLERDLFRADRRPADVAYDPKRFTAGIPIAIPPRPPLRLVGLIAGHPPAAILDGLPGIDGGRVVHAGDTVGPLRVVAVTRLGVRVVGLDTVWTLLLGVR